MTHERFFERLKNEQDRTREQLDYWGQARARRAPSFVRRPRHERSRTRWAIAATGALAVTVLSVVWLREAMGPEAPVFSLGHGNERGSVGAFIAAPAGSDLPLRFADGTRVSLAAGTSARVASLSEHGAHLVIEKGRAFASVVHRPGSQWRVDVGPFRIAVVGTRFDVSWDAMTRVLQLRLDEGAVSVSGGFLRDAFNVRAGQTLRAFADDGRIEVLGDSARGNESRELRRDSPESVAAAAEPGEPPPTAPKPFGSSPPRSLAPSWPALAAAGKFRDALAAAERSGFDAECRRASGADLLALADAARLAGAAERAEQAYSAARGKLPGGGRASYGLGLVAFDQRRDFTTAARHFEAYLREQPGGSLRAEALGRLMEALQRSGQRERARGVAAQYLSLYPRGAQAVLARKLAP